ncbi:trypsin epsilon [Helicoverpa armigera]|uniref:trypsin epsilon n=1 Tax=Helicoverpa armigera TaxID=29058 RepID=UPI0030835856
MKKTTIIFFIVASLIFLAIVIMGVQMSSYGNNTKYTDRPCPHNNYRRQWVALTDNRINQTLINKFPYVAAVMRNATSLWNFACFASVILMKWIVTSAHCRQPGHTHRVVLFQDYARNQSHSYPILFWRIHEKYNSTVPNAKYDIAVARMNVNHYHSAVKPADFDEKAATAIVASVWKTVSTMDKKLYLTNHFDKYEMNISNKGKCFETYGVEMDDSLICIDTSAYDDCFVHEFGPIFSGDKVVGVIAITPVECDMKYSVFTNISYYTSWILRSTYDA